MKPKKVREKVIRMEKIKVGDILELKSGKKVRVVERRDGRTYAYPIWYEELKISLPNGCRLSDVKRKVSK